MRGSPSSSCMVFPTMCDRGTGWCHRWQTPDTACWCRICAAMAPRGFWIRRARMAQQAAIAQDVIDFADALGLEQCALAGFDWGNRAACIATILHPERVRAQVAINGYSVQNTVTPGRPASAAAEARLWYQWYFNTARGRAGLEAESARHHPVFVGDVVTGMGVYGRGVRPLSTLVRQPGLRRHRHPSYRHRHVNAPGESRFLAVERQLTERPQIQVPAIVLRGTESGFGRPSPDPSGDQARFSALVARRLVDGAGHDLPVQRPDAVSTALIELLT